MSDENQEAEEGLGEEPNEENNEPEISSEEEEARSHGWVNEEEWTADGKDSADWSNFKAFNKNGSLFRRINDLEGTVESNDMAMKNLNKFHEVQMNQTISEYERQKIDAIKDGDVELVGKIDEQIAETKSSGDANTDKLLIAKWNDDNDWIYDKDDPKAKFATNAFQLALGNKLTVKEAIAEVNQKIEGRFSSKVNERRNEASTSSGGGKRLGKGGGRSLTMADLTEEEKKIANNSAFSSYSEKEILVMVKNSRIEA